MDVMIEAAPMAAEAMLGPASGAEMRAGYQVIHAMPLTAVASSSRPRRHSIIARGPNNILREELVPAAA